MTDSQTTAIAYHDEETGETRSMKLAKTNRALINRATRRVPGAATRVWNTAPRTEDGTMTIDKAGAVEMYRDLMNHGDTNPLTYGNTQHSAMRHLGNRICSLAGVEFWKLDA